jgi:Mitochondrial branched-chain alpha-ketoacid dehydrogenase kinase
MFSFYSYYHHQERVWNPLISFFFFIYARFQECAKYMSSEQIANFLDSAIRNRVAVRLIAEQHIVLSRALQNPDQANTNVGIVDMTLSPVEMIRMCGSFVSELCEATLGAAPPIVIDGTMDATFACVPIFILIQSPNLQCSPTNECDLFFK